MPKSRSDFLAEIVGERTRPWRDDVVRLADDPRLPHFCPFLYTQCDDGIDARSRNDVSVEELWGLHAVDLPRQLFGGPGTQRILAHQDRRRGRASRLPPRTSVCCSL